MPAYRVSQAAALLGVSPDTVRRWADAGRLAAVRDGSGQRSIEGAELAAFAASLVEDTDAGGRASARNHLTGLVTKVTRDKVMAQVELAAGPFRIVSLISREAADELGLEPGVTAVATIKSTNVALQLPPT